MHPRSKQWHLIGSDDDQSIIVTFCYTPASQETHIRWLGNKYETNTHLPEDIHLPKERSESMDTPRDDHDEGLPGRGRGLKAATPPPPKHPLLPPPGGAVPLPQNNSDSPVITPPTAQPPKDVDVEGGGGGGGVPPCGHGAIG